MKNYYISLQLTALLLLSPMIGWAQSIAIPVSQTGSRCVGSVLSVSFTTAGTFAPDNTFTIQLSPDKGLTYVDLPGSFTGSPASTTLPAMAIEGSSYVYRVVASKPQVMSDASVLFKFNRVPSAQLTGSSAGTVPVNPYATANLQMVLTGGAAYTLTMQDSTQFVRETDSASPVGFPIVVSKTTTYRLASVRNACGAGVVSGSATVTTNRVGFLLQTRYSDLFCLGSTIPIYFSTDSPLPPTTVFEAELINQRGGDPVTLPVSGTASPLQVTLPAQLADVDISTYRLHIFSRTAGLSAYYNEPFGVFLHSPVRITLPKSVSVTSVSAILYAPVSYTGSTVGSLLLSDGQVIQFTGGATGTNSFQVDPGVATSYSIVSYTGECSAGAQFVNRVMNVLVPPINIDSLSAQEVCAGNLVTLYYTAKPGFALPARLAVWLRSPYDRGKGVLAEATAIKPGQLAFTPPASMTYIVQAAVELRDATVDTVMTLFIGYLTIKTIPQLVFVNASEVAASAGEYYLKAVHTGGGITTVAFTNGFRTTLQNDFYYGNASYLRVYVPQTTTFSTLSVTNQCGTMPGSVATTVNLATNTPPSTGLYIIPDNVYKSYFCPNSPVLLNVVPTGAFGGDNKFQVEIGTVSSSFNGTIVQTSTQADALPFTLPTRGGRYVVRVSSTNPVTYSNLLNFDVSTNASQFSVYVQSGRGTVRSSAGSPLSVTMIPGEYVSAQYDRAGFVPSTYEFSDGIFSTDDLYLSRGLTPKVTTTYTVKRVTNACGESVIPVVSPLTVVVQPLQLITYTAGTEACVGVPVQVAYVARGAMPTSVSYVVQASIVGQDSWQTLPTSGTASPLTTSFPASMANKFVNCRVAYIVDGVLIPSAYLVQLTVKALPNVSLTAPNNMTAIELDQTNVTKAELRLTDALVGGTVILSNGLTSQVVSTSTASRSLFVTQPGTYSVVSAYNSCGYGQTQGVVRVTEKPYLALSKLSRSTACVGEVMSFTYSVGGSYEAGNKLSVGLVKSGVPTSVSIVVSETTALSGVVSFSLSSALEAGSYYVQLDASAPKVTFNSLPLDVDAPISATLLSGTRVVYPNDLSILRVVGSNTRPYSLTLAGPGSQSVIAASSGLTDIPVTLTQSGSYSVVGVSNVCGTGRATGSVSFSVLPASAVTIRPELIEGIYCTDKPSVVYLKTTGIFSATNTFSAYLTESSSGSVFVIPVLSGPNQITLTIPASTPVGDRSILQIGSTSPLHLGASLMVRVLPTPIATLTGTASIFRGDSTRISVALTGTPPWQLTIADLVGPHVFTATKSPFDVVVKPDTDIGYRLTEVRNDQCGVGTARGIALITVSVLLATEPALPLTVRAFPNPTSNWLHIEGEWPTESAVQFRLINTTGRQVHGSVSTPTNGQLTHRIDLSGQPAGVYILTAEADGRRSQFKVVKE